MHQLRATVLALAGLALERASAAVPNLTSSCQIRCYDLTADMVGCGVDDYRCHCDIFDSAFVPQMQSYATELKETVCSLADPTDSAEPGDANEEGAASALPVMTAGVAAGILAVVMAGGFLF
ncbi:unnamed protein product [Parascedosporium putredinis]|uniref:Extracellular membrane protein CFEM domain-containing protein n=1 Tax=Parascedosporium putredinis TaxID=1442378 RepID=A0A9P1M831_9PEZI|nr:unnamed protein product [Parascedosporium putredinis]CAI7989371.1 unnamed protein product [Parascedosporium putredinis]